MCERPVIILSFFLGGLWVGGLVVMSGWMEDGRALGFVWM
jgi:hypothetical protein